MDKITLLVSLLFVIASALAFFLWQRISKVEEALKDLNISKEEKQTELENTKKTAKRRTEELESVRDDLQSTKAKLKKLQKKEQEKRDANQKDQENQETASHVGAVVRVSNEEVETRHQKQVDELKAEISSLQEEVAEYKAREEKAKAETEKAARALKLESDSDTDELDPEALKTQIEALKRAAGERETELKRGLKRAKADARSHERRASTNHQLYQVAKGQLSLLEDRLARLKLKHEGAIDPSSLIKEKPQETESAPVAEEETQPVSTNTESDEAASPSEESAPTPANDDVSQEESAEENSEPTESSDTPETTESEKEQDAKVEA